ncbi:MAG: hypothetical protein HONBIEJF_00297 [Fimbriimonadaceae bacterium]|nr:hypothetical protein [Fimbriimonadaceae bacterium]
MIAMRGLWRWDQDGFRAIHEGLREPWLDPIVRAITITGLGHVQALVLLGSLIVFRAHRKAIWFAGVSGILAGILRALLVRPMDRQRPSNFEFARPMEDVFGNSSFPSGHATGSFAIATALCLALRGTRHAWVGYAAIFWASLVAFSRVYVGVHFITDVIAGACLGALSAGLVHIALADRILGRATGDPAADAERSSGSPGS